MEDFDNQKTILTKWPNDQNDRLLNEEWRVKNEKREKGGRISEGNTAFLAWRKAVLLYEGGEHRWPEDERREYYASSGFPVKLYIL